MQNNRGGCWLWWTFFTEVAEVISYRGTSSEMLAEVFHTRGIYQMSTPEQKHNDQGAIFNN